MSKTTESHGNVYCEYCINIGRKEMVERIEKLNTSDDEVSYITINKEDLENIKQEMGVEE